MGFYSVFSSSYFQLLPDLSFSFLLLLPALVFPCWCFSSLSLSRLGWYCQGMDTSAALQSRKLDTWTTDGPEKASGVTFKREKPIKPSGLYWRWKERKFLSLRMQPDPHRFPHSDCEYISDGKPTGLKTGSPLVQVLSLSENEMIEYFLTQKTDWLFLSFSEVANLLCLKFSKINK